MPNVLLPAFVQSIRGTKQIYAPGGRNPADSFPLGVASCGRRALYRAFKNRCLAGWHFGDSFLENRLV
jgi:hypothetical protein